MVAAALLAQVVTFVVSASVYGWWLVDDAGISFAYAFNLANGEGLVSQPGAAPVEGFSNPAWVLLITLARSLGLLDERTIAGQWDVVALSKLLALVLHVVVLGCLATIARRGLAAASSGRAPELLWILPWSLAGLLLAVNPSYVIWMVSGLENPLLAAAVAATAAAMVRFVTEPSPRLAALLGLVIGLAAITRPDGMIYLLALVVVALPTKFTRSQRWWALAASAGGAGAIALSYLVFRLLYYGEIVPNTAVAKGQGLPTVRALGRLVEMGESFGPALACVTVAAVIGSVVTMRRDGNDLGVRVASAALLVLGLSVVAFVVLRPDWMEELRFLTPAWPLVSLAAAAGSLHLVVLAERRDTRLVVAAVVTVAVSLSLVRWADRAVAFRDAPTVPLCFVAERYGAQFDLAARELRLDPARSTLVVPDVGGTLLTSQMKVVDLAGLADVELGRLQRYADPDRIRRHLLEEVKPTFVHLHGVWKRSSGLFGSAAFDRDYVELVPGEDWVRRDAVPTDVDLEQIRRFLTTRAARLTAGQAVADCSDIAPPG